VSRIREILEQTRTIAVLGLNDDPSAPARYVPEYLHEAGYRVLGVNPKLAGQRHFAGSVTATLAEIVEPVDMVDVFRRTDALEGHVDDILAMRPLPKVVWLQLGLRHEAFARRLEAAGIEVVQDRCTLAEHRRLGVSRSA
jgi:uncharacterized protein